MKPFPIWCDMCAKQNECHIADTVPKCYEPKQTEPSTDGYACLKKVGAKAEQTEPSTDCSWK